MENIFVKIGYSLSSTRNKSNDLVFDLLYINNPDGTPRWIWNASCKKPLFLKFYNVGSKRAFLFASIIKLVFILKLQKIVFKNKSYFILKIDNQLFNINTDWALFTGTVGPNNKIIVYSENSFYKVATTETASKLIHNEHRVLEKLSNKISTFLFPKSIQISESVIQLSDISKNRKRTNSITTEHVNALMEMSTIDNQYVAIKDWALFQKLKADFHQIIDNRIPKNMLRKINWLLTQVNENDTIPLAFSHGDFTQWNMYHDTEKIAIYDWELSNSDHPYGYDFFHYIIQKSVLVDHKNWKEIYPELINCPNPMFHDLFELQKGLKRYLLINCMHYLAIFEKQKEWHLQVEWLLKVWNEALNTFLSNQKTARELVIIDLFDTLQNTDYATLKFYNGVPEKLNAYSDIDMVIPRNDNAKIVSFLKNHFLVSKITTNKKSFMNTIQVFFCDGTFLSIDLIWELKRKNILFLDADALLKNLVINTFGVKCTSTIDTARYIVLFYILNNAKIPLKYLAYERSIVNSNKPIDKIIKEYFVDYKKPKSHLLNVLKKKKKNKGINYYRNTLFYFIDSITSLINNRGFTITFSGVDGAGKSTVIENITKRIEKQLRKPVVVLRHRPSILPILSVWSKGKEKAHRDTISNLPRQGNNKSLISSFIRFSYYYIDYLLGQFVIYFKYIIRGYVVIYDRYYFDFINDSKRSNIVLPKPISFFGYHFLLKPKFNFFLFADASTILQRKQELNKTTIEALTNDYHMLFQKLQNKTNSSVYKTIKNDELELTLNSILKTITNL